MARPHATGASQVNPRSTLSLLAMELSTGTWPITVSARWGNGDRQKNNHKITAIYEMVYIYIYIYIYWWLYMVIVLIWTYYMLSPPPTTPLNPPSAFTMLDLCLHRTTLKSPKRVDPCRSSITFAKLRSYAAVKTASTHQSLIGKILRLRLSY